MAFSLSVYTQLAAFCCAEVPAVPCGSEGPLPETKEYPGGRDHTGPQYAEQSLEKGGILLQFHVVTASMLFK